MKIESEKTTVFQSVDGTMDSILENIVITDICDFEVGDQFEISPMLEDIVYDVVVEDVKTTIDSFMGPSDIKKTVYLRKTGEKKADDQNK
ncbi:MAG TPA: hypothetical protein ENI14_02355 [Thermoplasmatales archaeon]|nr:hypothetical protein [Thermoplasmatales archaeon]